MRRARVGSSWNHEEPHAEKFAAWRKPSCTERFTASHHVNVFIITKMTQCWRIERRVGGLPPTPSGKVACPKGPTLMESSDHPRSTGATGKETGSLWTQLLQYSDEQRSAAALLPRPRELGGVPAGTSRGRDAVARGTGTVEAVGAGATRTRLSAPSETPPCDSLLYEQRLRDVAVGLASSLTDASWGATATEWTSCRVDCDLSTYLPY